MNVAAYRESYEYLKLFLSPNSLIYSVESEAFKHSDNNSLQHSMNLSQLS